MTPATERHPALHSVGIHIDGKGFVYMTPDKQSAVTITVRRGDHIKWNCDHGNFSILFKGESPFTEIAVHGRKSTDTSTSVVTGKHGKYTYAVTVALPDGGLIVDDPEVIVDGD